MRRSLALGGALLVLGAAAYAQAKSRPRAPEKLSAAAAYQAGVDRYAQGRLVEALAFFEDVQRREPTDRLARVAVERVRIELAMAGRRSDAAPPPAVRAGAESDDSFLSEALLWAQFATTLGEARERQGRIEAMQGEIAQLLSERRVSQAHGRAFTKNAELHALSRRLS